MREREQRDEPVLHGRHDAVERLDRRHDVVVGQHHALRCPGRAAREDELEHLVRRRALPAGLARLPVGGEGRVVLRGFSGERLDRRRREVAEARLARIGCIAAGPEDQMPRAGRLDDHLDRVG